MAGAKAQGSIEIRGRTSLSSNSMSKKVSLFTWYGGDFSTYYQNKNFRAATRGKSLPT